MANITFTSDGGIDTSGPITSEGKNVLTTSDIYNGLDKLASGNALDARQGKVLNDAISDISNTSGVAEQGMNYIRYTNGLQICWDSRTFNVSFSGGDRCNIDTDWSFPKSFISQPILTMTTGSADDYTYCSILATIYNTWRIGVVSFFRDTSGSGIATANYIAIGRWK